MVSVFLVSSGGSWMSPAFVIAPGLVLKWYSKFRRFKRNAALMTKR